MSSYTSPFPPPDPVKLKEVIDRDRVLCEVQNMDRPDEPSRLIRLRPKRAAQWCYTTSMGSYDMFAPFVPRPIPTNRGDGSWVCGPWIARVISRTEFMQKFGKKKET